MDNTEIVVVTKEELNKISYHKLKEKFEEMGVIGVWKPGKKKAELIEKAISKLAVINRLKQEGVPNDKIQEVLEEREKEQEFKKTLEKAKLEEEKERQVVKKNKENSSKKGLEEQTLPKDVIIFNLKNIKQNLLSGNLAHRKILLEKKEVLVNQLESIYGQKWES